MYRLVRDIFSIFTASEKKRAYFLLLGVVCLGFLEVVGVASIAPFMAIVSNNDLIHDNDILSEVYQFMSFQDEHSFLIFSGTIVLLTMLISNACALLVTWLTLKFTYSSGHELGLRLFSTYLHKNYPFFLVKNSSHLTNNIFSEVDRIVKGVLLPLLQAMARVVVISFLFFFLIIVSFQVSMVLFVFSMAVYFILFKIVKKRLQELGEVSTTSNAGRYQSISEAFSSIKYLKLVAGENFFLEKYCDDSKKYHNALTISQLIAQIPRYALESIAFSAIVIVIIYFLVVMEDINEMVPILAIYIVAGYKMLPSLQQVFSYIANIRFHIVALENLKEELRPKKVQTKARVKSGVESEEFEGSGDIIFNKVFFQYPESNVFILKNLSLKIRANSAVGIVGSTGSGKTTVVDLILGLLQPSLGEIAVDRTVINSENISIWQRRLGYVPQSIFLIDKTVLENIAFGIELKEIDEERVKEVARIANIDEYIRNKMPDGYRTRVGERGVKLSGGQCQRIGIARALYHDPAVLVLDEATSALDEKTEIEIMTSLRALYHKMTVIIVAHRTNTLKGCDQIIVLEDGTVKEVGSYQDVLLKK